MTLPEAASALAISTSSVRRLIHDGHLRPIKLGRRTVRVSKASVERLARTGVELQQAGPAPLRAVAEVTSHE
jgi:excisionase family DNA binding protein